jgi:hypothetical protein
VISKATTTAKTKENAEAQRTQRNAEKDKGNDKSLDAKGAKLKDKFRKGRQKTTPKWGLL